MKNVSKNKQMFNFSIDPEIRTEFIELATKKSINKSSLLTAIIKKWIEENREVNN